MTDRNIPNDQKLPTLDRYDLVEKSHGMAVWKEMQHAPKDGDWVPFDHVAGAFAFIEGYLLEHQNMLSHIGVHTKVVKSVEWIRSEIKAALEKTP
jgi:hypothetical protein